MRPPRDHDIWRWLVWGSLLAIAFWLYQIAVHVEYIAAKFY